MNFRIMLLLINLKILKHKLILSLGEQFGLEDLLGDEITIAAAGMQSSFALSMFNRFILSMFASQTLKCSVTCINLIKKTRENPRFSFFSFSLRFKVFSQTFPSYHEVTTISVKHNIKPAKLNHLNS